MENVEPILTAVIAAVAGLAIVFGRSWWRGRRFITIHEWQRGLLYKNGRFLREMPPGRYRDSDAITYQVYTIIPQTLEVAPQEALTADRFAARLSAVVGWRVPAEQVHALSFAEASPPDARVRLACQQALRQAIAARTLDELLGPRAALDAELAAALRAAPALAGLDILTVETRDLILAAEVRRMLTDAERSRREAQAALERARGEQAVLRSLANSARLLKGNPALMNLRLLQALQPANGKTRPTVVLGGGSGLVPLVQGEDIPGIEEE